MIVSASNVSRNEQTAKMIHDEEATNCRQPGKIVQSTPLVYMYRVVQTAYYFI
jgi:hypothetical protein